MEWAQASMIITTIMISIIAYFLKRLDKQISDNNDERKKEIQERKHEIDALRREHKTELEELRNDFDEMKDRMPFTYVLREDYIRSMAAFGNKLDKIHDHIVLKDKG